MKKWPEQRIQEVADGIFTIVHGQGEVGVANANFIIKGKQAIVIDTMTFPEMTANMVRAIALHGAHVESVINTHHHIDHMGGNGLFAGAQILAHPESLRAVQRLGFPTHIYDRLMPQFRGYFDGLELTLPTPMRETPTLPYAGELHIFTSAHTAADISAWFPESRVLLTGDLCFIGVVPLSVNGLISGWLEALDSLIALDPAIVVPGHGQVGTKADLVRLRAYFSEVQRIGRSAVAEQMSLEDALAIFDPGPYDSWIEAKRHIINIERVMQEERGAISRADLSTMPPSAQKP